MIKLLANLKNYKIFRLFIYFLLLIYFLFFCTLFFRIQYLIINPNPQNTNVRIANDFYAYFTGGIIGRENIEELYDPQTQLSVQRKYFNINSDTFLQFNYPPIAAHLFIPFTFIDAETSNIIWLTLNIMLLGLFIIWIFLYYKDYEWWVRIFTVILILSFYPLVENFVHGQISLILTQLILVSWFLYKKNKDFLSGLILSLLFIKLQYTLLLLLAFLFGRNKKILGGFLIGIISISILSFLSIGLTGIKTYALYLIEFGGLTDHFARSLTFQHNIFSLINTHLDSEAIIAQAFYISIISIFTILIIYIWNLKFNKNSYANNMRWAALIISILLVSPHTNIQDYTFLLAVFVILAPKKYSEFRMIPKNIKFFIVTILPTVLFLSEFKFGLNTFLILYLGIFNFILISEVIKSKKNEKIHINYNLS